MIEDKSVLEPVSLFAKQGQYCLSCESLSNFIGENVWLDAFAHSRFQERGNF